MNSSEMANEITKQLRALGKGSRQGHRPSAQDDLGVYTSDLRNIVRSFKKKLKTKSGEFVLELARKLIAKNVTECRQVAYELIAGHKAIKNLLNDTIVTELGTGIDNWACVDLFCCYVAGMAWREGRVSDSLIESWIPNESVWWRRAAVVATVALNTKSRGGKGDPKRTLKICQALLEDSEEMVQKAISWAIRELVPWDRQAVEEFLDAHNSAIPARVKREVKRKLETGKKNLQK